MPVGIAAALRWYETPGTAGRRGARGLAARASIVRRSPGAQWQPPRWLLASVALCLLARLAGAEERPYPTLVVLGQGWNLGSSEGLPTPVAVVDHRSGDAAAGGALHASLRTSVLRVGLARALGADLEWEPAARAEAVTQGNGNDLYRDGTHAGAETFAGHGLAALVAARLHPKGPWGLEVEGERMATRYEPTEATRPGYRLPPDFSQDEARFGVLRRGLGGEPEAELALRVTLGQRHGWRGWALDPQGEDSSRYRKQELTLRQPWRWSETSRSAISGDLLWGARLDLFSGYRVGGIGGERSVAGFFRNEFRAREALVVNAEHEWTLASDRRLTLYAEGAQLRELAITLPGAGGARRTIGSAGLGYRHGIRALGGAPVIVRYAEGFGVPGGSKEPYRRELMVLMAAGF
ncbi:MAG: hypothetical protein HY423_12990 [Candidatus Lambdaproteobacteria bacterium]|nr:hypothetical protein [Candidatus Lambdaproteobacteria bacterium]